MNGCWARRAGVLILTLLLAAAVAPLARASHAAPTGVTLTAGASELTVDWTASSGADGYRVQWKSGTENWDPTNRQRSVSSGSTTTDTIPSLTAGTTYTVRVGSTKGAEEPAWSTTATGAPLFGCEGSTAVGTAQPVAGANNDLIDDCETLLALKDTLVGSGTALNWSVSRTISTSTPAAPNWTGVLASSGSTPRVTRLTNLDGKQLKGRLPAALGNLSALQDLSMPSNQLTGPIPAGVDGQGNPTGLARLSNLKTLDLAGNKLTGGIPAALGELSNLTTLRVYANQLTGTIPAGEDAQGNPTGLARLSNLKKLNLGTNKLTGGIPAALGKLSALTLLGLHKNQLTGAIPTELGNLTNLDALYLSNNQLTGSIPSALGNLANLRFLYLHTNQLSGAIPKQLGNLSALESLLLNDNQLSGAIPKELGNLAKLESLDLYTNQLSGSIPSELGNLAKLRSLALSNNNLSGPIPSELGNLASLTELYLQDNQLSGAIPKELGNLSALYLLLLHNNQLSGAIPAGGGAANPTGLAKLSNLLYLRLDGNRLTGTIPAGGDAANPTGLARLSKLEWLILRNNQLTGAIPAALGNLPLLQFLYLNTNWLSGPIPPKLGDLTKLERLYLNCNKLTGTIPNALGSITTLKRLGLNGNSDLSLALPPSLAARTDVTYPTITCPALGLVLEPIPDPAPAPRPGPRTPRLTAALSGGPDPVHVGGTVTYTLTVTNTGGVPLTGVFWRSPELGVAQRAIGDGALTADAAAETTFSFGPVTDQHLSGPIVVNVFADSDQTGEAPAALAVAVLPAAPTPTPAGTGTTPETPAASETAPADPRPAVSDLDLFIVRAFYSAPDPPDPNLGHNILDLRLTLADGTVVDCFFLTHYARTGGLARWGYATSEILEERPGALTQYYQRGAVDCHFRDGQWRVERRLTWDFLGGGVFGAPDLGFEPHLLSDQPGVFPGPWGHRVSNFAIDGTYTGFLNFFQRYGAVPAFGYPKTEARYDDDPAAVLTLPGSTAGFIRQYFQAAVFEYHPGDPADPVKLGLAGDTLRDLLYPNQSYLRFASFRPAPILTAGEGYVAERVIWEAPAQETP